MTFRTNTESAHLYRLNGDYNPLHATPGPGKTLGYSGVIMHGLFSWNVAAHAVVSKFCGSKGSLLRDFEARFAAPVEPGDQLDILMWDMGSWKESSTVLGKIDKNLQEIRFVVKVGDTVVLSDGRALLNQDNNVKEGVKSRM
ncbi:hypothetical protein ACJ72_06195 [Emergomyces africanus]|uniref:MaoC-like domain-containing protein n=1 Tax=Emergomyces africanus TaxID=1955775 RepID=A0A1B7NRR2_9EURO|nr:hypothetical protein ACJ72_06195 [Emergomyces africanus]